MGVMRPSSRLAALVAFVALTSGCDILLVLIVSPFFPGQPIPPPPDLSCPPLPRPAFDPGPLPDGPAAPPPIAPDACGVGDKALHRLNRFEYDRTVHDLTGLDLRLADGFPADDSGYGFDNNADVLATAPLLVEKYEAAARTVAEAVLARPDEANVVRTLEAEAAVSGDGAVLQETAYVFGAGRLMFPTHLPVRGTYRVSVRARADRDGEKTYRVRADDDVVATFTTTGVDTIASTPWVGGGAPVHFFVEHDGDGGALIVDFLEIEGPLVVLEHGPDPPARARVLTCAPDEIGVAACADEVLRAFARRAWRRPVDDEDAARLVALVEEGVAAGDDFEPALQTALAAVLLSPRFLFRVEFDDDPTSTDAHPLDDHELATRLSYFLWSSTPDDRLLAIADRGALQDPEVLAAEARRMLADPRSRALAENFAPQWLGTRALDVAAPDRSIFRVYDEELKAAMRCETETFFDALVVEDRPLTDVVAGDTTFVNERLANHYAIEHAPDAGWTETSLADTQRRGVLGHASVLTTTSYPTRTSPAKRGKFVLEQLLCLPPPPPPPDVPGLPEDEVVDGDLSLRELFERHRSDPQCAGCHEMIDPFGFALERFDAVGRQRETDNGVAIDDSGLYLEDPDAPFHGLVELAALMAQDAQVPRCVVEKTMSYALGRGLTSSDACVVDEVAGALAESGYATQDLFVRIALTDAFRARRGEPEPAPAVDGGAE